LPGCGACASGGCNSRFPLFLLLVRVGVEKQPYV